MSSEDPDGFDANLVGGVLVVTIALGAGIGYLVNGIRIWLTIGLLTGIVLVPY